MQGVVKEGSSRVLSTETRASSGGGGGSGSGGSGSGGGVGGYQGGVEVYVGTIIQVKEQENKVCVSYECEGAPTAAGLTLAQAALEGKGLGGGAGEEGAVQDHEWLDYFSDDIAGMKMPDTLYQHSKVKRLVRVCVCVCVCVDGMSVCVYVDGVCVCVC